MTFVIYAAVAVVLFYFIFFLVLFSFVLSFRRLVLLFDVIHVSDMTNVVVHTLARWLQYDGDG